MSNVGGSAGDGGFQFQAKIIAFVAVHILAEVALTGLEQDIQGIPRTVAAETNGPGDDIRIEFTQSLHIIEIQAKKGLHGNSRFDEAIEKIAAGLCQDITSRVVLAVDPMATGSIRQKLPLDLRRLRQGREDTPHDRDLFLRVIHLFAAHAKDEAETRELAKRFFVHVFDMEKADVQNALTLLRSHILLDEKQAKAAWNFLVQAGHELITTRGRYDAAFFVRYLQRESDNTIHLRGSLPSIAKNRYQAWLLANTATFRIPGPSGVSLPIESAWIELDVLSKQDITPQHDVEELLRHYHEQEQFASHADKDVYAAKDVGEIGHRVVIAGGPGAGKSLLCRKLVHDLTDLEEVVLWIDLPALASRLHNGMNINTALIDISTDAFDAPFDVREALLAQVDCLIADGLDECGDSIVVVAEALQRWATAHTSTRIVLTSRPIGYEIKYFPEWEHYTLMPLTKNQVQSSSQELIQGFASDRTTVEKQVVRFRAQLKNNHVASLAARNPLLLGFLIQLSLDGEDVSQHRAGLYEQILNVWRMSLPQDRTRQALSPDVLLAWRSLELMGWLLLSTKQGQSALSHDQLVQQMSQRLAQEMNIQPLLVSPIVSNCLQFWHEQGVLDHLQVGHKDIYTFVHTTFLEYAAGRYLARLSFPEIQRWVRNTYHDARWREPILLAAGSGAVEVVVETLLEMDAKNEQGASVLLFASAALAGSSIVPDTLAQSVIDRLIVRLVSINPILAYEVAEQGTSLVKKVPDLFVPLLQPLFAHHQKWTRLTAIDLALASGSKFVEIETVEHILKDVLTSPISSFKPMKEGKKDKLDTKRIRELFLDSNDGWDIQNDVIVRGTEVMASTRPDTATKELLKALFLSSAISGVTHSELAHTLKGLGCQEFVEQHQASFSQESIRDWLKKSRNADQKMLEVILRVTHFSAPQPRKRRKLLALTTLIHALDVPESGITQWDTLNQLDDVTAIEAVLQGFIHLYGISRRELALDTMWTLEKIQEGLRNENTHLSLLQLLPKIPIEHDVTQETSMNVPIQELIRALKHPSTIIANGAALLLVVGGRRVELEGLLQQMKQDIDTSEQMKMLLGKIVPHMWENDVPLWLSNLLKLNETSK